MQLAYDHATTIDDDLDEFVGFFDDEDLLDDDEPIVPTLLRAFRSKDDLFLAEIELWDEIAEITTVDDSFHALCPYVTDVRNEVAAYFGYDDDEVYVTNYDKTEIID